MRPRSRTACPFSRAQDLSSALPTVSTRFLERTRPLPLVRGALLPVVRVPRRRSPVAAGPAGAAPFAVATVSFTPYSASMTRMTCSIGSVESMLTLNAIPCLLVNAGLPARRNPEHGRPFAPDANPQQLTRLVRGRSPIPNPRPVGCARPKSRTRSPVREQRPRAIRRYASRAQEGRRSDESLCSR